MSFLSDWFASVLFDNHFILLEFFSQLELLIGLSLCKFRLVGGLS